jgi:phage tail-like protein
MSYLDDLPAIFAEDAPDDPGFLAAFLRGIEAVLTGVGDGTAPGLEEVLDGIDGPGGRILGGLERYFSPLPPPGATDPQLQQAPAAFLDWLGGWVGLVLRADVTEAQQRALIAAAVQLYAVRGTKAGLERLLSLYDVGTTIEEDLDAFQIGVHSTLGVDTRIDGGPPHYFRVRASLPVSDPARLEATRLRIRAIVDAEKPAHTFYDLVIDTPEMQIGVRSTIGVDTMLGEGAQ